MFNNSHNFGHKIVPEGLKRPRREPVERKCNFGHKTQPLNLFGNWFKQAKIAAHTRVRIKRLVITPLRGVIPPPSGVVREPGSRRLTVRYKRKKLPYAMPYSDGAVSPIRSGPKVPKKKKKKNRTKKAKKVILTKNFEKIKKMCA